MKQINKLLESRKSAREIVSSLSKRDEAAGSRVEDTLYHTLTDGKTISHRDLGSILQDVEAFKKFCRENNVTFTVNSPNSDTWVD